MSWSDLIGLLILVFVVAAVGATAFIVTTYVLRLF
jgi:hypothetical protein